MDCSTPGFPVRHQLPELTQTHVHHVGDAILSSVVPFSSCLQSFPALGSFPMSQFFTSGGWSIRASALASVLPMNIQDWFPLGWTGLLFLQSKGLSRVFSTTRVQKHQFFSTQPFLWSNSHIHTWLLKNHSFDYMDLCRQKGLFLSTLFYSFQMPRHNISKRGHESVRSRLREKVWCQKYSLGLNSRSTTFYLADLSISFPIFTFFFSLSSKRGQ